jgi:haloalkane dehalogenase
VKILRTPDERFAALPDYDFAPRYTQVPDGEGGSLRVHHIDEGPADGPVVLCMHGEPSWCFLYRKMVPVLVNAGLRVVAPDLVGFGRSDKPAAVEDYTYQRHVDWMTSWLRTLGAAEITLVCQDWGGLIGLRLVAGNPDRFARVVVANTGLPTGDLDPGDAFKQWLEFSQTVPELPVSGIIDGGTTSNLDDSVRAAYDAPFPDESYKAGARVFPTLVPISPDDPAAAPNRAAWGVLSKWDKPFLTAFSDLDPISHGGDALFQQKIPGCKGQAHTTIEGGGHFLQEDRGEELAKVVADFVALGAAGPASLE